MPEAEKETGRLEAFSDGVFAIAMTLLVLELKVPHLADGGDPTAAALASGLRRQWPGYFAFVTSFFSVLVMWVHHHIVLRLVRRADATLLFTNGLLLLLVTVVPYPTAVLAEYLATPAAGAACEFYALIFLGISLSFLLFLHVALRPAMMTPEAPAATVKRLRGSYWLGPPCYALAWIVSPFSPWLAMGICTALWILWTATTREC